MPELIQYSIKEIEEILISGGFPISGVTPLGSAEFHLNAPAECLSVAVHAGGRVRPEIEEALAVDLEDRFREEDPYTDYLANGFPLQIIARDSRFEYDLNWEIENSVYPADQKKWDLQVWKQAPNKADLEITYSKYREFHELLDLLLEFILKSNKHAILFDLHSYCYQREKRKNWWDDSRPEINLGTRSINRDYFTPMIESFLTGVSGMELGGHPLRVAENEIFPGGYLTRKYAQRHSEKVLVLAIEYKKIFMDEWSGELFPFELALLADNLLLTKDRILRTKV